MPDFTIVEVITLEVLFTETISWHTVYGKYTCIGLLILLLYAFLPYWRIAIATLWVSGNDVFDFFLFPSKSMQNTRYGCKITKKMVNNKVHIFRVWIKSVKLAPK